MADPSQCRDLRDPMIASEMQELHDADFATRLTPVLYAHANLMKKHTCHEHAEHIDRIHAVTQSRCTERPTIDLLLEYTRFPLDTAESFYLVWVVVGSIICKLPLKWLQPFRPGLVILAARDPRASPPQGIGLWTLIATANDLIRFMDFPQDVWTPQHKGDYMAERSLQERVNSGKEMRTYIPGLLTWLADPNWPPGMACRKQLARYPEETVEPIRDCFLTCKDDSEWLEHLLEFVSEHVPIGPLWITLKPVVEMKANIDVTAGRDARDLALAAEAWLEELRVWKDGRAVLDSLVVMYLERSEG